MSVEHSIICDRCGSVVAAAPTLELARADAAQLGAQQDPHEDLCARCSPSSGASVVPQSRAHRTQPPASATSTRRLGDELANTLGEYVRGVVDARIAELSGSGANPADKAQEPAAKAFPSGWRDDSGRRGAGTEAPPADERSTRDHRRVHP